ncbi:MAG: hypothetical protein J6K29_11200 [Clostridia bacterium]|nr:hypothetical protein [Clostridia bacterium]
MEQNQKAPLVVSIAGLPKRKQKKVVGRITKEVTKDKGFKKSVKKAGKEAGQKIPKVVKAAAVKAAVEATLGTKTGEPVIPEKKTGSELYTDLVGKFAASRKKNRKKQANKLKAAKKEGFNPATGLYTLKKADRIKTAKKVKYKKAKKK